MKPCRKRTPQPARRSAFSSLLADIRASADQAAHASALAAVNAQLRTLPSSSPLHGRLTQQVAHSLQKRGQYAQAARALASAASLTTDTARDWLRPRLSLIRALIKDGDLAKAQAEAAAAYTLAQQKVQAFHQRRLNALRELRQTGRVIVPLRPHRPCVVARAIGHLFLLEGEIEPARKYFQLAIHNNPRGGARARQGLAEIALRQGDPATAFQRATEALLLGKFQAKTLATWKLLLAAKRQLGHHGLPPELLATLQTAAPGVRARATLAIATELRRSGDPAWRPIAQSWLAAHSAASPAVTAELRKLFLADTRRLLAPPAERLAAARQLLATPGLSPTEWLAAAKELTRSTLQLGADPAIPTLVAQGQTLHGPLFALRLRHSLALSCMMAKRHDLARPLLQETISLATPGQPIWSKALWALARMEAFLGRHQAAVPAWLQIAQHPAVPDRFRLQARLCAVKSLLAANDPHAIRNLARTLPSLLESIQDPVTLLDFARQLKSTVKINDPLLTPLASRTFERGKTLALRHFHQAAHPSAALALLFPLLRRQVNDFHQSKEALAFWNTLPPDKKLWLWQDDARWWGALSCILQAHLHTGDLPGAAQFLANLQADPAVPRHALPRIAVPYHHHILLFGSPNQKHQALAALQTLTAQSPTAPGAAQAHYWLALHAWKTGNRTLAHHHARALLDANTHTEALGERWLLEASARLLLAGLTPSALPPAAVHLIPEWTTRAQDDITTHLASLPTP